MNINRYLRRKKTSLDLVPTYQDFSTTFRNGKEKEFEDFFKNTSPDDLSKDCMRTYLDAEKETLQKELEKEIIAAKDVAEKIVLMQQAEAKMLLNLIDEEVLLQEFITTELKKEETFNE